MSTFTPILILARASSSNELLVIFIERIDDDDDKDKVESGVPVGGASSAGVSPVKTINTHNTAASKASENLLVAVGVLVGDLTP
jgi:hypothetical protein